MENDKLNSAMSQLRSELDNAFAEVVESESRPAAPPDMIKQLQQELKLTQYLLRIKERQFEEEVQYKEHMQSSILTLASALAASSEADLSLEWMLSAFSGVLQSGSLALWAQTGEKTSVSAAHISIEEAEDIFRRLLPVLEHTEDPRITLDGSHHLVFTHSEELSGFSLRWVLVFTRNSKRLPFSDGDIRLGQLLAKSIFNTAIFTGEL